MIATATVRPLKADRILLLGSAPAPLLPSVHEFWELWTVNASAKQADYLGLGPPKVSVVDLGFFSERGRSVSLEQVADLNLG